MRSRKLVEIARQLDAIRSAPWPRSAEIGVSSLRSRVPAVLGAMLRELDRERLTLPAVETTTVVHRHLRLAAQSEPRIRVQVAKTDLKAAVGG
jgi:hypothetical protein